MQIAITITDSNVPDVATALGYRPNPLDQCYPTEGDFVQSAVTDYVRRMLIDYRARQAASAETAKSTQL